MYEDHQEMQPSSKSKTGSEPAPLTFREDLDDLLASYFKIWKALAQDKTKEINEHGINFQEALKSVDMKLLSGEAHIAWMKELEHLNSQASTLENSDDINKQREAFYLLSETLISVVKQFGTGGAQTVLQFHCPMAFKGKGADWLQNQEAVENPYFGEKMLKCGEKTAVLATLKN